jgi:hypothetical protein
VVDRAVVQVPDEILVARERRARIPPDAPDAQLPDRVEELLRERVAVPEMVVRRSSCRL